MIDTAEIRDCAEFIVGLRDRLRQAMGADKYEAFIKTPIERLRHMIETQGMTPLQAFEEVCTEWPGDNETVMIYAAALVEITAEDMKR